MWKGCSILFLLKLYYLSLLVIRCVDFVQFKRLSSKQLDEEILI
mgnify:CR=1 FL=1